MYRVFFAVLAFLLTSYAAAAERSPSASELEKAYGNVQAVYGDDFQRATTPEAKAAIVTRMLQVAREEKFPAQRYVLLQRARELAAEAGAASLGFEATKAIVDGFTAAEERTGRQWIAAGDELRAETRKATSAKDRLEKRLKAAECYLRAAPGATGLTKELIDKKIEELSLDGVGRVNRGDARILLGAWNVETTKGYHGTWVFASDGTVRSGKIKGTWTIEPHRIFIRWNAKAWESFHRPLDPRGITGDSVQGPGILTAHKAATP